MIEDLKPYPQYKDSGLPWLGEVPSHWDVSTLGGLARVKSVANQSERQLLSVYLQHGVVRFSDVHEKRTNTTSEDLSKYQAVDPGDFVLNNQQAWRGSVGVSDYTGIISPAYLVLKLSKRYLPRYANLLFRDQCMVSQYLVCSKGVGSIQRNLYWPHLKRVGVALPPPEEQADIARFLAWATNRLDRAIGAKRRIITLLQEQKQAIIHRAVTRGLDPSVPLKDSGIPWLGEIPEHWEVRRLKDVATVQTGITLGKDYGLVSTTLYPYLRVANVQSDRLDLRNVKHVAVPEVEAKRSTLMPGDVLMTEGGDIDKLGRGCLWSGEVASCLHQNHVFAVRCGGRLIPGFLVALMGSAHGRSYFQITAKQTTNLASTNSTTLKAFPLLLPEYQEQQQLLSFIDGETGHLSRAITDTEREITLLREYRTRLIADVVTGKLDVREAAAGLPEEEPLFGQMQDDTGADIEPDAEDEAPEETA